MSDNGEKRKESNEVCESIDFLFPRKHNQNKGSRAPKPESCHDEEREEEEKEEEETCV